MRGPTLLAFVLAGCVTEPSHDAGWASQLHPDSPCYEANLLDGVDTTSTAEEHAVFACLDQTGAIDALSPLDTALDGDTRDGAVGLVLAGWLMALPTFDLSLPGLVDDALALLDDPDAIDPYTALAIEAIYAEPYDEVVADGPSPSAAALDAGLVVPALPLVGELATQLLDDAEVRAWLGDTLRDPVVPKLAWTLAAVPASSSAPMQDLAADWPDHLVDAIGRVEDTSNDHADTGGNSLRALATAALGATGVGPAARPMLEDPVVEAGVRAALQDAADEGWLDALPGQLWLLVGTNVDGGSLGAGEDSALTALLRLLVESNTSADCSIDLGFTSIDFSFGNLAVTLLEKFAALDPDSAVSGVGLLGDLLGVSLTTDLLQGVADTGVCPVLDDQLVADLGAIDRLNDTPELLRAMIVLLGALDGHVEDLVDTVTAVWNAGLVPPLEEALRDLADAPLAQDLVTVLPALLEPSGWYDLDELPAGADVVELEDVWSFGETLLADGETLRTFAAPLVADDATWTFVDHLGVLLDDPDAHLRTLLDVLADVVAADPDVQAPAALADRLDDHAFTDPLLVLVESAALRDAVATTDTTAEGPLPFAARMVTSGTLDVILDTLRLFRSLLPESSA